MYEVAKKLEPFFSTYIATGQDGGLRRHLLVDAVLQASQVEVGIPRKEIESNPGSIGTSQTDSESEGESESETRVGYGIKRISSNGSD
jgi:hypothetical protein